MLYYIEQDKESNQAFKNFENTVKQYGLSKHQEKVLLKLASDIKSKAYSAGYANAEFDQAESSDF